MADIVYSIKYNRMKTAVSEGFAFDEGSVLKSYSAIHNMIFFKPIDTAIMDNTYGRLRFDYKMDGNCAINVYLGASNELYDIDGDINRILDVFSYIDGKQITNTSDCLLYDFSGRYFYLAFILEGDGNVEISNIKLYHRGDNFMGTFPEVYQERNSFFHRFMSAFSSIYNDMEAEIDNLPDILNLDTADASLLPIYGRWLGIDVGDGFLKEDVLRTLVKESYALNRIKGTKYCLERISEIILGKKGIVVERNMAQDYLEDDQVEHFDRLYGDNLSDVTLLIQQSLDSIQLSQLEYILEQFLPINCSLYIVMLQDVAALDGHVYLDINSTVYKTREGSLDGALSLDGEITLS